MARTEYTATAIPRAMRGWGRLGGMKPTRVIFPPPVAPRTKFVVTLTAEERHELKIGAAAARRPKHGAHRHPCPHPAQGRRRPRRAERGGHRPRRGAGRQPGHDRPRAARVRRRRPGGGPPPAPRPHAAPPPSAGAAAPSGDGSSAALPGLAAASLAAALTYGTPHARRPRSRSPGTMPLRNSATITPQTPTSCSASSQDRPQTGCLRFDPLREVDPVRRIDEVVAHSLSHAAWSRSSRPRLPARTHSRRLRSVPLRDRAAYERPHERPSERCALCSGAQFIRPL
jgi:hypothetical protein